MIVSAQQDLIILSPVNLVYARLCKFLSCHPECCYNIRMRAMQLSFLLSPLRIKLLQTHTNHLQFDFALEASHRLLERLLFSVYAHSSSQSAVLI